MSNVLKYNNDYVWDKIAFDAVKRDEGNDNGSGKTLMKKFQMHILDNYLTERQKEIYLMRYADNQGAESIAKQLGISTAAVYKHLRLSNRKLERLSESFLYAKTGKSYIETLKSDFERELQNYRKDDKAFMTDYYIGGMSIREISEKYDLPYSMIDRRIYKCRQKLYRKNIGKKELGQIRRAKID